MQHEQFWFKLDYNFKIWTKNRIVDYIKHLNETRTVDKLYENADSFSDSRWHLWNSNDVSLITTSPVSQRICPLPPNVNNADYVNTFLGTLTMVEDVTRGRREWLSKLLFLFFFAQKKSILVASQTEVEPLMSHGLFYRCIYYVSGPGNISVVLLSMEGQIALRFHQKHSNKKQKRNTFVFRRWTKVLRVWNDMRVSN